MRKFLTLFVIFIFAMPCFASTWVQAGKYEYIDIDNIETYKDDNGTIQSDKKTFWLKHMNKNGSHKSFEKLFKRKLSHSENLCIIDLKNKTHTFKAYKFYDEKGTFIYDYSEKDSNLTWKPIKKNSNSEFWYIVVTNQKFREALVLSQQSKK